MLLGLRTVIYPTLNLTGAKKWHNQALGIEPYFDEDSYVDYNVAGHELALDPHFKLDASIVSDGSGE